MKITSSTIYRYNLPFVKPFSICKISFDHREGLILQLTAEGGLSGFGEIAPLEGLSREPLKKALHDLKVLQPQLIGRVIPNDLESFRLWMSDQMFIGLSSSLKFGLESACIHLLSQKKEMYSAQFLGGQIVRDVLSAGLLQGTLEEVKLQAATLHQEGVQVYKLKVGNKNIPLDVKKVNEVRAVIGPQSQLRLDANREWGLNEAVAFGDLVGGERIQFIEEPVREIKDVPEFYKRTHLPVALDESLYECASGHFQFPDGVQFCVVKPMIMGGVLASLDWIIKSRAQGRKAVISSSFESGIGSTILANLALLTNEAAGLGTSQWFKDDLLKSPLSLKGGLIMKKSLQFTLSDIRMELLNQII